MKKILVLSVLLAIVACVVPLVAAEQSAGSAKAETANWRYMAAAISVGLACVGGGIAVGQIGAAALGAMAENPELSGKALPFVGLAEGICLWGFLVAMLILFV
jgi:V/A-type H+/Na+-transporting ATPase subunit K